MLTRLMVVIIPQYIQMLNHYAAYLKLILYVIYISIKNYNNKKKSWLQNITEIHSEEQVQVCRPHRILLTRSMPPGKQFQVSELQFPDQ